MKKAKAAGAAVANGTLMLENQAEASWEIWNK
jgi:shikimate 5-dehydrogenase